ncbi:hypothetical protein KCP73_06150 [Salmonella enterica subsp. enterica]|nr:hypothetical protein KCP73_06150 [Salmonella enterica subsp. enterica]
MCWQTPRRCVVQSRQRPAAARRRLHIINKSYWHMICQQFYGDYLMQRKAKLKVSRPARPPDRRHIDDYHRA